MVSGATPSFANEGREKEMERGKAESGRKDGESMNGSLGILQRQREMCVSLLGASIYDISPLG